MASGVKRWAAAAMLALVLGGAGEGGPQLEDAFLAAFGTSGPDLETEDGTLLHFSPGALISAPFGMVLLSPASADMPSPVTFGSLGVHYLAAEGHGLRVTGRWPEAIGGGTMGNPPEWVVDDALARWPVVIARTLEGNQGYYSEYVQLVELTPKGPVPLVTFRSSYSDGAAGETGAKPQEIEGKIVNIIKDQSFEVEFTGTSQFRQTYSRKGDRYEMTASTGSLPDL
jgi:hypothetical protein